MRYNNDGVRAGVLKLLAGTGNSTLQHHSSCLCVCVCLGTGPPSLPPPTHDQPSQPKHNRGWRVAIVTTGMRKSNQIILKVVLVVVIVPLTLLFVTSKDFPLRRNSEQPRAVRRHSKQGQEGTTFEAGEAIESLKKKNLFIKYQAA